jgi:hypothetical protein
MYSLQSLSNKKKTIMVSVILARVNSQVSGGFEKEIITLALDPHWSVPSFQTVNGHNYEVRQKGEEGSQKTYSLSDSAVPQN